MNRKLSAEVIQSCDIAPKWGGEKIIIASNISKENKWASFANDG